MGRPADSVSVRRCKSRCGPAVARSKVLTLLWQVISPGVCRVVANPTLLKQLLARYPAAEVTRIIGVHMPPSDECTYPSTQ